MKIEGYGCTARSTLDDITLFWCLDSDFNSHFTISRSLLKTPVSLIIYLDFKSAAMWLKRDMCHKLNFKFPSVLWGDTLILHNYLSITTITI